MLKTSINTKDNNLKSLFIDNMDELNTTLNNYTNFDLCATKNMVLYDNGTPKSPIQQHQQQQQQHHHRQQQQHHHHQQQEKQQHQQEEEEQQQQEEQPQQQQQNEQEVNTANLDRNYPQSITQSQLTVNKGLPSNLNDVNNNSNSSNGNSNSNSNSKCSQVITNTNNMNSSSITNKMNQITNNNYNNNSNNNDNDNNHKNYNNHHHHASDDDNNCNNNNNNNHHHNNHNNDEDDNHNNKNKNHYSCLNNNENDNNASNIYNNHHSNNDDTKNHNNDNSNNNNNNHDNDNKIENENYNSHNNNYSNNNYNNNNYNNNNDFLFPPTNNYDEKQQNDQLNIDIDTNNIEKQTTAAGAIFIHHNNRNNNNNSSTKIYENSMSSHYVDNVTNDNQSTINKNDNTYDKRDFFLCNPHHHTYKYETFNVDTHNNFNTSDPINGIMNYKKSHNNNDKIEELDSLNTINTVADTNVGDEVKRAETKVNMDVENIGEFLNCTITRHAINDDVNSEVNDNFDLGLMAHDKLNKDEQKQMQNERKEKEDNNGHGQGREQLQKVQQELHREKFLDINVTNDTHDNQHHHNHNFNYEQSCQLYTQNDGGQQQQQQQQQSCIHPKDGKTYEEQKEKFLHGSQMNDHYHHNHHDHHKKYCLENNTTSTSISTSNMNNNQQQEILTANNKDQNFLKSNLQHNVTVTGQSPLHQSHHQNHHQNHIMQDVYRDIIMHDYHEEANFRYKINLSPANLKPENQDDGYETSVGDVLIPNTAHPSLIISHQQQQQQQQQPQQPQLAQQSQPPQQQHARQTIADLSLVVPSHHNNITCHSDDTNAPYMQQQVQSQHEHNINAIQHLKSPTNMYIDDVKIISHNSTDHKSDIIKNELSKNCDGDGTDSADDDGCHRNRNEINNTLTSIHCSSQFQNSVQQSNYCNSDTNTPQSHTFNTPETAILNERIDSHPNENLEQNLYYRNEHNECSIACNCKNDIYQLINQNHNCGGLKKESTTTIRQCYGSPSVESISPREMQTLNINMKERKKHDRFNGMTEEEVGKRTLPDHLSDNLDIVIIGINPGLFAAYKGHHYAGPGNHFWKCLYLSGLTQVQMSAEEDYKLIKYGIGFTNMVQRATKGSADLTRKEIKNGSRILLEKLQRFRPKIAVFNGKLIFEVFSGKKDFNFGRQPECVEGTDTFIWVMPSSSARCAQLPRAADKVPFYTALKKFRDYLNGLVSNIDEADYIFTEERIKQHYEQDRRTFNNVEALEIKSEEQLSNCFPVNNDVGTVAYTNPENCVQNANTTEVGTCDSLHGVCNGPGPPFEAGGNKFVLNATNYLNEGQIPEKKKRGRPKKVQKPSISVDPIIPSNMQQMPIGFKDCITKGTILNLSMLNGVSNDNSNGMPKKKRGRPKKIKHEYLNSSELACSLPQNMLPSKSNNLPVQDKADFNSYTEESNATPQKQISTLHTNNTNHSQMYDKTSTRYLAATASPVDMSSCINFSYATVTPPIKNSEGGTINDNLELESKSPLQTDAEANLQANYNHVQTHPQSQQHNQMNTSLQKSPQNQLTSPKNVTREQIDFEERIISTVSTQGENEPNDITLASSAMQENMQHDVSKGHYINQPPKIDDNFQQWLTAPKHSRYSPTPASYALKHLQQQQQQQHHQQQQQQLQLQLQQQKQELQSSHDRVAETLHYEQQQHMQHNLRMQHQQSMHPQWSRHHPYLDMVTNPYILPVSQYHYSKPLSHHNTLIEADYHQHHLAVASSSQSTIGDIARKSLTGLETLIEQIPTITENQPFSSAPSTATDVNSILTNANDLQEQQATTSFNDSSIPRNNFIDNTIPNSTITGALNEINANESTNESRQRTNLSTPPSTNLATSNRLPVVSSPSNYSTTSSVPNNDNYTLNQIASCPPHNSNPYHMHHTNMQMAAAVFAVTSASNTINHHHNQHIVTHPQMYIDPHTHIASPEPLNSLYTAAYHDRHALHQPHYHANNSTHHLHSPDHYSSPQHFAVRGGEYACNSYQSNGAHMLHMPSPNYPYGFAAATTQRNYIPYSHPNSGHMSVYNGIKSSDISSYGGF